MPALDWRRPDFKPARLPRRSARLCPANTTLMRGESPVGVTSRAVTAPVIGLMWCWYLAIVSAGFDFR